MKIRALKTVLWFLFGAGLTVIILRIINGPGSVVALTDLIPWGLWKGGGVVALVPIGGAGFTLAAFVYVFHWNRYKPLALGAVLLGLMCYSSVAAGLTFDIGIWWRIVFPVAFWQFHSTLFEIAWCIMLYLGVLAVEFSHVVLKKYELKRALRLLDKFSIVFVIAGICLSTLHQSSLGTLFLATPYRLHPLWHTDLLPLMFFMTAIGLGCLTISWVAISVHKLYGAKQPMNAVSGLGRISSFVLFAYLVVKFAEIVVSGEVTLLFQASWDTFNFWIEVLLSALIPAVLLQKKSLRQSPPAMFWISTIAIIGMSLNRVNVAGLATVSTTNYFYFPAWTEWVVTFGILAGAALVFLTCVECFGVFKAIDKPRVEAAYSPGDPDRARWYTVFFHAPRSEVRVYSASLVLSVGVALGFAPVDSLFGVKPKHTEALRPAVVDASAGGERGIVLKIDGNRDGDCVLFDHEMHIDEQGNRDESCVKCHHMKKPGEKVSMCVDCHKDMYLAVDIFDHETHAKKMGGNKGCAECHTDPAAQKTRATAKSCDSCHEDMRPSGTFVQIEKGRQSTMAPGYLDAMHGLCVSCHEREKSKLEKPDENFARCANCHGNASRKPVDRLALRP
jgi:Ni/Fe-hydrogenase subunit HybB-like protein